MYMLALGQRAVFLMKNDFQFLTNIIHRMYGCTLRLNLNFKTAGSEMTGRLSFSAASRLMSSRVRKQRSQLYE